MMKQVQAGTDTTLALSNSGRLYGWGLNNSKFLLSGTSNEPWV
jgi:alpha-tubulin suppressor-like RCC1 family protein